MSNVTLNHTLSYKMGITESLTIHGMYQQPSTTLQNSTPKLAGQSPESNSKEAIYQWNTRQDFLMIQSL